MNALEIRGLTKSYGDFTLSDLNLTLPQGCIMGLVGENGAGKSTTVKLILGMLQRDSGTVTVYGRDNREDTALLKEDIGTVLDEVGLPECLTVRQIGAVMKNIYRRWDEKEFARLTARMALPENKPFKEFSRGMKMKLGIAVALSHHSKLLILDEATSGLDPVARDEILDMFIEFTREEDHAILISSHIVSDLEKLCDYVAFLHNGKLLLCEEKDRLLDGYGLLHCTAEELRQLPESAVLHKKENPYGIEALVLRSAVPAGVRISPVSMEELFVFMVKEA